MGGIAVDREGHVAVVRFDRPEAMNSIDTTFLPELAAAMRDLEADESVRAVVTTGEGSAWCTGADLAMLDVLENSSLNEVWHEALGQPVSNAGRLADRLGAGRLVLELYDFPKPWIAAVNGAVAGGGLGLCLLHDVCLASDAAVFTTAFAKVGVTSDLGLSWTLPRIVGRQHAADLFFTARLVDAAEALAIGLVQRVVPADRLLEEAVAYAAGIAASPAAGIQLTKIALQRSPEQTLRQQLELEWPNQVAAFGDPEVQRRVAAATARFRDAR